MKDMTSLREQRRRERKRRRMRQVYVVASTLESELHEVFIKTNPEDE